MLRFPPILACKCNWMCCFHRPSKMRLLRFRLHCDLSSNSNANNGNRSLLRILICAILFLGAMIRLFLSPSTSWLASLTIASAQQPTGWLIIHSSSGFGRAAFTRAGNQQLWLDRRLTSQLTSQILLPHTAVEGDPGLIWVSSGNSNRIWKYYVGASIKCINENDWLRDPYLGYYSH